jgi:hypothetical protein
VNLIDALVEEKYMAFLVSTHDNVLEGLARIGDPELPLRWPQSIRGVPEHGSDVSARPTSYVSNGRCTTNITLLEVMMPPGQTDKDERAKIL